MTGPADDREYQPSYGDLVQLNTARTVLDAVGDRALRDIVGEYLELLDTSSAIYERNGDYAVGIFSSGWCQRMDRASRELCGTPDNRTALDSGRWLCHESCWTETSKVSIETGAPADVACAGGIRLHAVPIRAGDEIVGSINVGYGDPPRDPEQLRALAEKFQVDPAELAAIAAEYRPRDASIVEHVKRKLPIAARRIGEIIARHQAERALRRTEAQFRRFFDDAPIGKVMTAPGGGLLRVNKAFCEMLGYDDGELANVSFATITHPDDIPQSRECIRQLLGGERDTYSMEKRYLTRDGRAVWTHVTTRLQRDEEGKPLHFLTHILDISERKRADERLQATVAELRRSNEELEQFAYVASHDLQEPLRMVSSYTQLLRQRYRDKLDAEGNEFIDYAVDGAKRMQRLIQDLLMYSRVTTKGGPLEPVDVHEALEVAVSSLQVSIRETAALVTNEPLPVVRGDPTQVTQLLQNLIGNALKFHKPGESPRVHISAARGGEDPRFWTFRVADQGIGIDPKYFGRLFVIFQRLHTRHEYPGTGIGLALCKRIVERHSGRIWIESELGKGTTCLFTLPSQDFVRGETR